MVSLPHRPVCMHDNRGHDSYISYLSDLFSITTTTFVYKLMGGGGGGGGGGETHIRNYNDQLHVANEVASVN